MDAVSYLLGKQSSGGGGTPNLQDKSVTITQNGNINVSADTGYDGLNSVGITTSVQPVLETKSVTITTNTTTTITPTAGKDGLSSVEVTTNVAGGGGLDWSAIGYSGEPQVIIDGYNYAVEIKNSWTPATSLRRKFKNNADLVYMPLVDTSTGTDMREMFNNCSKLASIPLLNTSSATTTTQMFLSCSSLVSIPLLNTSSVTDMNNMFNGCTALKEVPILDTSAVTGTGLSNIFWACVKLSDASLDNILRMCINATSYTGTKTLAGVGVSNPSVFPTSRIEALPHYQDFIDAGWTIGY